LKIIEHDREFTAQRSRYTELELSIVRLWTTIDAGISTRGRDRQPIQVMRPTPVVVGALGRVRKTAMGHAQQGAAVAVDKIDLD
jgi:hypothetical protein